MKCWGARFLVFTLTQTTISADCSKMNFIGGGGVAGVLGAFAMTTGLIWWPFKYTPPPNPTLLSEHSDVWDGEGFVASIVVCRGFSC